MSAEVVATDVDQYLSFFVGDGEFALGILEAREISQYPEVTKVPAMPPAIRGVINLRGNVVPVLDLAVRLGMPERPVTRWTCVVVVESVAAGGALVGIIVDRVSQVIDLPEGEVQLPPDFGTAVDRQFLRGMGKSGQKFILILNLDTLLTGLDMSEMLGANPESATSAAQDTETTPHEGVG